MHGMKAFNREKIEDAIVDAASITTAIGSPMKNIFLPVLRKQQNPQLKRVSGISGEDGLGVSAIVDTQRVLVGSRELMDRYGIILPSLEQEAKLRRDNFEILYVARAGRLSAVFVISYNADDEIAETLYDLQEQGIQIMVHSMDPFITVKRISEIFDLDENGIGLLEGPAAQEYRECAKEKARTKAYLCSTTSPVSLANAILCTERVRGAISVGNILQLISMILGFGIVAFFRPHRLHCTPGLHPSDGLPAYLDADHRHRQRHAPVLTGRPYPAVTDFEKKRSGSHWESLRFSCSVYSGLLRRPRR